MAVWGFLLCTAVVLSTKKLKGLLKMKKYKIIGLTLWKIANVLLIWQLWDYLLIAPLFIAQIIISVCCSILFCIEFSSIAKLIVENVVMIFLTLIAFCYIIHFRQPVGIITLISSTTLVFKNILCERKSNRTVL